MFYSRSKVAGGNIRAIKRRGRQLSSISLDYPWQNGNVPDGPCKLFFIYPTNRQKGTRQFSLLPSLFFVVFFPESAPHWRIMRTPPGKQRGEISYGLLDPRKSPIERPVLGTLPVFSGAIHRASRMKMSMCNLPLDSAPNTTPPAFVSKNCKVPAPHLFMLPFSDGSFTARFGQTRTSFVVFHLKPGAWCASPTVSPPPPLSGPPFFIRCPGLSRYTELY